MRLDRGNIRLRTDGAMNSGTVQPEIFLKWFFEVFSKLNFGFAMVVFDFIPCFILQAHYSTGRVSASFTSTAMDPTTQHEQGDAIPSPYRAMSYIAIRYHCTVPRHTLPYHTVGYHIMPYFHLMKLM